MTSDQNKCGLSSLLPMSCQERAEDFARRLHSRLTSLGSTDNNNKSVNETTWLTNPENSVTSSQPRQGDPDLYFDFGSIESPPGSPEEETGTQEGGNIINNDNLNSESECSCSKNAENRSSSQIVEKLPKELTNGHAETEKIDLEENFATNCTTHEEVLSSAWNHVNNTEPKIANNLQNGFDCPTKNSWTTQELNSSFSQDLDDDILDESEVSIPRVRRCSSLKTGKTPPGTPGRKKIVRFADVLGLDLADVRTFLDEIPKIPTSAYTDLKDADLNDSPTTIVNSGQNLKVSKVLVPLFQQPGGQPDFINRIRERQVCLDNAMVADPVLLSINGTVRVKNLDFHKTVHIRYTLDSWQTFADVQAIYVENSCDGFADTFSFTLFANTLPVGHKLEFAIRFQCKGCQYWDNNKGVNYCFQCLPPTDNSMTMTPSLSGIDDNWTENLYY